jgi:hypothetical protein
VGVDRPYPAEGDLPQQGLFSSLRLVGAIDSDGKTPQDSLD